MRPPPIAGVRTRSTGDGTHRVALVLSVGREATLGRLVISVGARSVGSSVASVLCRDQQEAM